MEHGRRSRLAGRPAVFLDKDGTILEDVPYNVDPDRIRLARGAGEALAALQRAGFALFVITNQPGVALGYHGEEALARVEARLREILGESGVFLSGFYYCPHHPEGIVPEYGIPCTCRKPQPGLILRAALEHEIDLSRSWFVGDILNDVEAGRHAGCRTILLDVGNETEWRLGPARQPDWMAPGLPEAARLILATDDLRPGTAARGPRVDPEAVVEPGAGARLARSALPVAPKVGDGWDLSGWERAGRILCVRLDALGDVLMTSPAIRALKEARPGRHITLLTSPSGAAAASLIPEVDDVIVYDAPWMKATAPRADGRPELDMAARLRAGRFDAAAIFTVYSQNPLPPAFLCHLADIPLRLAHCRENPYQLLSHRVPEPEPERFVRHEVQRQLDLVAAVGAKARSDRMAIRVPPDEARRVHDLLGGLHLGDGRPWVLIHPGASAPSRRYPPEAFAEAARRLVLELGCAVVFSGTDPERALVDEIRRSMGAPSHSLAGELSVGGLAALIARAPVLVANNTGPAHIAAAVGTPVVDLYALTNPQHTPWRVAHRVLSHDVPCKYCYKSLCPEGHHDCLRLVPAAAVSEAARALLHAGRPGAGPAPIASDRRTEEEEPAWTPWASTPPTTTRPPASSGTGG